MPYKIFWCKVNKYFLNQRLNFFYKNWNDLSDTLLIATCVVTDRAKNKRIKEAKAALESWLNIMITWCGSLNRWELISKSDFFQIYPEIVPFQDKIILLPESPEKWNFQLKENRTWIYTKHFLVIQNWCDNHCSFCLTVAKRWSHISRPLGEILDEIHQVESQGTKEIVITWINLAARWCPNSTQFSETRFPYLLREILRQTTIPRIRISSVWPEYANDEFFDVISDERILPHFHYSIQSFSNNVLQKMRRHYSWDELKTVLKRTRNISRKYKNLISIGADIIVWFPGETDWDFLETFNCIEEFWITKLHAFPFSDHTQRDNIPASLFPNQINQMVKKEREKKLIIQWDKVRNDFLAKNRWTSHKVLLEEKRNWKRRWRTENYIQIEIEWDFHRWDIIDYII